MARILLVDDERLAQTLYADYLLAAGHEVKSVGTITDARQALSAETYEAVVTDLLLPEGDGLEVLQYAKERFPGIEVIVITALDKVGPAVRAIKSGASEYLVKPVTPEALQLAISRALSTRQILDENASLRRYVSLLETGQRIATMLDRDKLVSTACHGFMKMTGASAVMLFSRHAQQGTFTLQGAMGLPGSPDEMAQTVAAHLTPGDRPVVISSLPGPFHGAWAYPAIEAGTTWGYATLLYQGDPPADSATHAAYLAQHLALAWRNLGRFAEVEDLAYVDDLTRLFNVRYLHMVLDREIKNSQQTQIPFSLLFLDLDYFKSVNDTHGHLVGSKLLVEAGRVLKSCVRDNDVVARYGGDEYVVMLRGTDSGGALKVAERIRRTFETTRFLAKDGISAQVTTCIGVASFPEHTQDKATLLDFADRAMYRGKKSSRNVVYMAAIGLEATPSARHTKP
ncbi:MAG TPA: diguanylate cyclase [Myxococcaceae bacterium]|nr:diguanylate cyclase [Myxococcaceae bacterium]